MLTVCQRERGPNISKERRKEEIENQPHTHTHKHKNTINYKSTYLVIQKIKNKKMIRQTKNNA